MWGGTVSGSKEKNAVEAIRSELGVSHERAQELYNRVEKYAYTTDELGKETRRLGDGSTKQYKNRFIKRFFCKDNPSLWEGKKKAGPMSRK